MHVGRIKIFFIRCVVFHIVEMSSFKEILTTFDKQYTLPGRKYFSKTAIPNLYNKVRAEVTKEQEAAGFAGLTTDMWSTTTMVPLHECHSTLHN